MKSISRSEERELFLNYIRDIYLQNPDLPISSDTIYYELSRFVIKDGERKRLDNDGLVGVQLKLNNKYRKNDKVITFLSPSGYFWVIQNRGDKSEGKFLSDIKTSIKLYVSVDADNLCKISESLFDFMIDENIVMECKLSKEMRNDALVCRIINKSDVLKVIKYLDDLKYESSVKVNPFLYDSGKVGIACDGVLSYNHILSKLIKGYLDDKRESNALEEVSCKDFSYFIKDYIKVNNMDKDNIKVVNLIIKNIQNKVSLDDIFDMYKDSDADKKKLISKSDEDKLLYVINNLTNYYSVSEVHKIIMKFIQTGDINLFTRKDDIRTIISNNFSRDDVKNIISELGWKAFVAASRATYNKYGTEQLFSATQKFLDDDEISGFTRDNNVRSYLGLVIPIELLKEVIENKISNNSLKLTTKSITDVVLEEINV